VGEAAAAAPQVSVRPYRRADVPAIARLYYETVHTVNARDYSPDQIQAWAPRIEDDAFWLRRFRPYTVFVANVDGQVAGFTELGRDGAIDCFYVHHRWQGRGVGRALMARLLAEARRRRVGQLSADVSITARAFFERMGFRVIRVQKKLYRNRRFEQYVMRRAL
jgi:putative acetyltransferase